MAEHYPHFEERVRIALKAMLGPEAESRIKIGMAKDGSGVGGT
jgi:hexokinase